MIEVRELRVVKQDRVVCRVPRLAVEPGERLAVVGSNGSGKTTLLRVLAGFESRYSGDCRVQSPPAGIVYVHQTPCFLRGTVLSNVTYGLLARGASRSIARKKAGEVLETLGIGHLHSRRRGQLSGGEVRRMVLARAAVLEPRVLLLDEPLTELDEAGAGSVTAVLAGLAGTTVVLTSPLSLTEGLATRVHELGPG